jgi:hypothetical protein
MAPARPIIALEFNELCPPLLERWMADGTLPSFRRLHYTSHVFLTHADVDDPGKLEPWIQWYSIHTGLSFDQHGVFHLTDGVRAEHDDIWRLLLAAGRNVVSFASMNVRPFAAPGSVFVGDPWTENGDAHPGELNVYNRFVGHNVREYTNAEQALSAGDYAAFLRFLVSHGLSAATAWQTLRQLAAERARSPHLSYRRVAILDALQFDVFAHYHRLLRPDFASFFVNSVAHLQHSYWRHMEPGAFAVQPDPSERERYGDAIRYGYVAIDRLLGRFLKLAERSGARIVFQTALSQQPFVRYESKGGQHFHRLRDPEAFLRSAGIAFASVAPTMTHQYMIGFDDRAGHEAARARLDAFELADGRKVFDYSERSGEGGLYFGAQISWAADPDTPILDRATDSSMPLSDILYPIDGTKSGCHHPVGCLWIGGSGHGRHEGTVSILDTLPTLLDLLGAPAAPAGRTGASLLPRMTARAAA